MALTKDLNRVRRLLHPYYIANIILCLSYVFLKVTPPCCHILFPADECSLSWEDSNAYLFLMCVLVVKNRRSDDWIQYLSAGFLFTKVANTVLFANQIQDGELCLVYFHKQLSIVKDNVLYHVDLINMPLRPQYIVIFVVFPEPAFSGPDNIIYFNEATLQEELEKDRNGYWLVEFYAGWSPPCVRFASLFAELSVKYSNDFLRFGKLNVITATDTAKKYRVDTSSISRQLPTVILFHQGKEKTRVPIWDKKGKIVKYSFNEANIIYDFDLNNLHQETLKLCKIKKSRKQDDKELRRIM
ncbi:thioredoxin-related transmembrane protein 2 homolog [Ptychodera flava]|uniref:thioredoxin-related transmembrane protein 2 homolog n=1 Tax=Ptychodera flava TaxID=63121 RepID=UPI003969BC1B